MKEGEEVKNNVWEKIFDKINSYFESKKFLEKELTEEKKNEIVRSQLIVYRLHLNLFENTYINEHNFFEKTYIEILEFIIEINIKEEKYEVCQILKRVKDQIKFENNL